MQEHDGPVRVTPRVMTVERDLVAHYDVELVEGLEHGMTFPLPSALMQHAVGRAGHWVNMAVRLIGVEEELMLVDPKSRQLAAVSDGAVLAHEGDVEVGPELFLQQIETSTPPCDNADDLAKGLREGRSAVGQAAAAAGVRAVAMPTPVLEQDNDAVTPVPRYRKMRAEYGELARQTLVCGMHVHVSIADETEGIRVIDSIRPWLSFLLAVSANSPYWLGRDTQHASWRSQIILRWPTAGPQQPFGDLETYQTVADKLLSSGVGFDPAMLYYDIRLAEKYPTVEIRVADVCTEVEDAVLVALLARALVETAASPASDPARTPADEGNLPRPWRTDVLQAATWRAARFGLSADLLHPVSGRLAPVREIFADLMAHCGSALEDTGDAEEVTDLFERVLARGTGATRQRSTYEDTRDLTRVVDDLARRTEESWT